MITDSYMFCGRRMLMPDKTVPAILVILFVLGFFPVSATNHIYQFLFVNDG